MDETSASPFGAAVRRREDPRLLTGHGRYASDVELPRLLHVAFVRSVHAHARVRGVETAAAAAVPGVVTVVSGADPLVAGHRVRARLRKGEIPTFLLTTRGFHWINERPFNR